MFYTLELTPDDNDTFLVTCPDLPEVTSFGDTVEEAVTMGGLAINEAVAGRLARFAPIPEPTPLSGAGGYRARVDLLLQHKLRLRDAMERAGKNRAQLARDLGWHRPQVDRLFDPHHGTKLDQFQAAFVALNQDVSVEVSAV